MAEILISLTIIGIIAAITLPSLQANINEKTWTTKRKALYSRMSQAISMMPSLNGYGIGADDNDTVSKAAQTFISDGLSKVLKISNICDGSNTEGRKKCDFPDEIKKFGKGAPKMNTPTTIKGLNYLFGHNNSYISYSQINTNAAAFETVNGESILTFYNPNCSYNYGKNNTTNYYYSTLELFQPTMCANFIFDLNGRKGPNQVGKDIGFMTAFYPTDSQIAMPFPAGNSLWIKDDGNHAQFSIGYGNLQCRKKYGDNARMANIEEMKSLFTNNNLGYTNSTTKYFISETSFISSSVISDNKVYWLDGVTGGISRSSISYSSAGSAPLMCVKH